MQSLTLQKAEPKDLDNIRSLYWKLLDSSDHYATVLQWKKNIYPADADWMSYIEKEEMYLIYCGEELIGAVAIANEQSAGYGNIRWKTQVSEEEVVVIHLLAIDPDYQGKGFFKESLDAIMKLADSHGKKAVRLDAITTNIPAQRLYERYGFVNCGTAKEYYESVGLAEFVFYEYNIGRKAV